MKISYLEEAEFKRKVLDIFSKYLPLTEYKIFVFGSRVKGDNFPRSDIDIGVTGPKKVESSVKLAIKEELENLPTLYKIDLVDFGDVSDGFRKKALINIEPIN